MPREYAIGRAALNKTSDAIEVAVDGYDGEGYFDLGEHGADIRKRGEGWLVLSMGEGKAIGGHESRDGAEQQILDEQAREENGQFASGGGGKKSGGKGNKKEAAKTLGKQFAKNLFGVQAGVIRGAGARGSVTGAILGGAHAALSAIPSTIRSAKKALHQARGDEGTGPSRVQRYDRGELAPAQRLGNGWLKCEGRSARTGILEYTNHDGTVRRELVLPDELFDEASLETARMVPVTSPHPTQLLDSKSARAYQVGSVGENLRRDGSYLVAPMMIHDETAVRAIEGGRQELSWGYDCRIDPPEAALVAEWGEHDGIQRDRIYNHLAVVDSARAGDEARIRLDAAGNQHEFARDENLVFNPDRQPTEERKPMPIRIDGHVYETSDPALQQAIDRAIAQSKADGEKATAIEKARADAAEAKAGHLKKNAVQRGALVIKLQGRIDGMKARMMGCDECGSTGKVADDAGEGEKACEYCGGSGKVRMHDEIKAAPPVEGQDDAEVIDDDAEAPAPEKMVEDDAMERDDPEEEVVEKKANKEHHDAERKRVEALRKKRRDARDRMVARGAKARAALLVEAAGHLGAEAKLDGKTNAEIRREVVIKLAPHLDAKGLGDAEVGLLYKSETARVAKARKDGSFSASDALRAGTLPAGPRADAATHDAKLKEKIDAANRAKYDTRAYMEEQRKKSGAHQ